MVEIQKMILLIVITTMVMLVEIVLLSDNDDPTDGEDPSECHLMDNGLDYLGDLFCDENLNQSDSNEVSSAEQEALYQRRLEEG